ncbi:DUF2721 domain-containing protein [Flavisphingomonas formosensis]|uniref:DUF2721 domain-containing protein n=1 Tax=Flavisphingomonas formosensis TaxID=861534 RepID=UPI0012FC8DD4|nr:DUF2721 domain-containing protein [Sphingomonas formosensis]
MSEIAVSDIAHTIQLALAPVFLLTGIAGLLNMLAGRLARVVDRARKIEGAFTPLDDPRHPDQVAELRILDRRIALVNMAILLCTTSAVAVCVVVAALFVASLAGLGFARTMAGLFVFAMVLLIAGLCFFLGEIRIAVRSIRIRDELLERGERP